VLTCVSLRKIEQEKEDYEIEEYMSNVGVCKLIIIAKFQKEWD
jgi:hypothetical protein